MVATSTSAAALPPPDKLRDELAALYRTVRITRSLLRLSERVHGRPTPKPTTTAEVSGAHR
ncbi:hypothetical protein [Gemmata sp.]|uniref:hypothetical protein n=1 Tax=Gemmata sp. TaxID=1914242 RepID=UPI003F71CA97